MPSAMYCAALLSATFSAPSLLKIPSLSDGMLFVGNNPALPSRPNKPKDSIHTW